MKLPDRVKETTATAGTGSFALSGAAVGFRTFAAALTIGDTVPYCAVIGAEWEVGTGTLSAASTLERTAVSSSSNGGNLVNFSAGTKEIFASATASALSKFAQTGDIPFAAAVPLTVLGASYMPQQAVSGVLAFTPAASAVKGALVYLRLVANGTHAPTFTGFKEWGGSLGYDNRTGIVNQIQFFYDGYDYWYSISQAVNAQPVPVTATAVTLSGPASGVVNVASSNFTVGTNGTRSGSVAVTPAPVAGVTFAPSSVTLPAGTETATFTATSTTAGAKTIAVTNNASLANPASITHTVAAAATAPGAPTIVTATAGDGSVSVAFTPPSSDGGSAVTGYTATLYKVSDNTAAGTASGAASPVVVTATNGTAVYAKVTATNAVGTGPESAASANVTPAIGSFIRMRAGFTALTESGTGPYTYTGTGGGLSGTPGGVLDKGLAAGIDGYLRFTRTATSSGSDAPMVSFISGIAPVNYANAVFSVFNGSALTYQAFAGGGQVAAANTVATAVGDVVQLRRTGSGGAANTATLWIEVSKDGGATWTVVASRPNMSTGALNFQVVLSGVPAIGGLSGAGLV